MLLLMGLFIIRTAEGVFEEAEGVFEKAEGVFEKVLGVILKKENAVMSFRAKR